MSVSSDFCRIVSLGYIIAEDWKIKECDVFFGENNDADILAQFKKLYTKGDYQIVGWNSKSFDIPIIWKRGILNGVKIS